MPTDQVEAAFLAADTFTVLCLKSNYHDVCLMMEQLALTCPNPALVAVLVEYTETISCKDEADHIKDLVWKNFVGVKYACLHHTLEYIGDICAEPLGTWQVVVAMGSAPSLPKAGEGQIAAATMVS